MGRADIGAHRAGTTFVSRGSTTGRSHRRPATNSSARQTWTAGKRPRARSASATNAPDVTLASLAIQHYNNGNGTQDGAIHIDDSDTTKAAASGWRLANLNVGFNSAIGSGAGDNWTFFAGRFHDNRQEGIGGAVGNGVTVGNVEIDHNNFTGRPTRRETGRAATKQAVSSG